MVITPKADAYDDFKAAILKLPPSPALFWWDQTGDGGSFVAISIVVSGNAAIRYTGSVKPSSWDLDFPTATQVEPGFDVAG